MGHKDKINDMAMEQMRKLLYSVGGDKKLNVVDIERKSVATWIKTANAKLKAL